MLLPHDINRSMEICKIVLHWNDIKVLSEIPLPKNISQNADKGGACASRSLKASMRRAGVGGVCKKIPQPLDSLQRGEWPRIHVWAVEQKLIVTYIVP